MPEVIISLSIYVHLLKGEYDNQLQWPLNVTITIKLLNWCCDSSHREKTIAYNTAPLEYRSRVTNVDKAPGWGCESFISHSVLETTHSNIEFISNDNICFKIENAKVSPV